MILLDSKNKLNQWSIKTLILQEDKTMNHLKQIPFHIFMGNQRIRNLEDFENEFIADEVIALYRANILQRWADAHGYEDLASALQKIPQDSDDATVLKNIWISVSKDKTATALKSYLCNQEHIAKRQEFLDKVGKKEVKFCSVIYQYHQEYDRLKEKIFSNMNDMISMRECVRDITNNYRRLLMTDHDAFTKKLYKDAPCAMLLFIANAQGRSIFEEIGTLKAHIKDVYRLIPSTAAQESPLSPFIFPDNDQKSIYTSLIKTCNKDTQASWDDIEPDKSKKYMIMYIPGGNKVRDMSTREEVATTEARTSFQIISGIEYNSKSSDTHLVYMEI